ncbi:hypothetical protein SETIT_1G076800v2 [Setaria italica]|uniref:Uncharacterized protein n=1 Tax=Setaria italica TaxID=4555 RepID=A0A368PJY3_SETIT|nr:hypothetical protein SETIT_1G076800v2 [Setaria italica]
MGASDFDLNDNDHRMRCFPAVERRAFCLDQAGRGFLLEADTSRMPKLEPISLYIPCADKLDDLDGGGGGSLFIMDRVTKPEVREAGGPFEALVYRKPYSSSSFLSKSWDCDLLPPPPPYTRGAGHGRCLEITSYALVNCGGFGDESGHQNVTILTGVKAGKRILDGSSADRDVTSLAAERMPSRQFSE